MNSRAGPVGSGVPRRRGAVGVSERGWTGQERPRRGAAEEPAPGARLPPGFMLGYVRPSCDPGHVLHLCASVSSSVGRTPPWERGRLEQGLAPGHHGGSTCGPPCSVAPFRPARPGPCPAWHRQRLRGPCQPAPAPRLPTRQGHPVPSQSSRAPNRLSASALRPPAATVTEVSFVWLFMECLDPPTPPASTARSGCGELGAGRPDLPCCLGLCPDQLRAQGAMSAGGGGRGGAW